MIVKHLKQTVNTCKNGHVVPDLEPNITKDTIFYLKNIPIGFYIHNLDRDISDIINVANVEFNSKRVPKNILRRLSKPMAGAGAAAHLDQHSAIIGTIPPKPVFRRNYITRSSVHSVDSATNYIKAMLVIARLSKIYIGRYMSQQLHKQIKTINANIPGKFQFTDMFTSAIANYNISAPYHIDLLNLRNCSNVIITRRRDTTGGHLHIPDYDLVVECANNSMLYYPAWHNQHGVTPIHSISEKGYRNTYIFYALKLPEGEKPNVD